MKTISLEVLTQQNDFFLQECFTQTYLLVTEFFNAVGSNYFVPVVYYSLAYIVGPSAAISIYMACRLTSSKQNRLGDTAISFKLTVPRCEQC